MYRLRELQRKDLAIINQWRNDPELIAFLGAPFRFINLDVDIAWFDHYMQTRNNTVRCAITREGEDEILGLVTLASIDYLNQSAELHIMIGSEKERGHGMGTFAVSTMLKHAFLNMNLHRVELMVLTENIRAQHLYEKCGFKKEGVKRKSNYKNGKFCDMYCYSILKEEFIELYTINCPDRNENTISTCHDAMSTEGGRIAEFSICAVHSSGMKRKLIAFFDKSFLHSVFERTDFEDVLQRIDTCAHFLLAYRERPLGYAAFYCNDLCNHIAYLSMIGVDSEVQHIGIGSQLLQTVESISIRYGMKKLQLEVWKDNKGAQHFYQKHAFDFLDKETDTSYFMQKQLLKE